MSHQHLLRKASIERLASPEQLDTPMRVTSPAGWLALATIGCILAVAVVWSVFAELPVKVDGTGILMRGGTVHTVQVPADGKVVDLAVEVGDLVEPGQVVARLELSELEREIETTEDRIQGLEAQQSSRSAKIARLQGSYRSQLEDYRNQLATAQRLHSKGLKRKQDVTAIEGKIAQIESQIIQVDLGEVDVTNVLVEERRKLRHLEEQLAGASIVKSEHAGRVAAVMARTGDLVQTGSRLLNLEADQDVPFEVLLFVPFTEGKKVLPEMEVKISPTNVKPEEWGFILGTIREVSSLPVTPEEVRNTLNNDQLAQRFAEDTPFRIRAEPELDPANLSGFAWTSAGGPPIQISSNTPCTAQVIVDSRAPISYVIPMLKKAVGAS